VAQRDELTILGKLITRFLAKFAQRDLLRDFLGGAVDLTLGHFPNCCANRNTLLVNENDFTVSRHRRNDHGCLTVHNCPCPWQRTRGCSHMVSHNFEMCISEMRLARHGFPTVLHNA
jgi:hypothetical protein